jgi:putative sugar O-methyltransferase
MNKRKIQLRQNVIKIIFEDFSSKEKIYKPSVFWENVSKKLYKFFHKNKIKNFKRNFVINNFFVPMYNLKKENNIFKVLNIIKKIKINKKLFSSLNDLISGKFQAFSDYRVFKAADIKNKIPILDDFTETDIGNPAEQFYFEKKKFSRSSLNYLLGLVFLKRNTEKFIPKVTLEIGGGYGCLGEILGFSRIKNFKYINVDLPTQAYVTEMYLSKRFGAQKITSYIETRKMNIINVKRLKNFTSLISWQIERLKGKIDLFVNFISFQEMEPHIVKNYLNIVSRLKPNYILLRNLREGKNLKKNKVIGVEKAIKSRDYVNFLKKSYTIVNINVIPFGFRTYDNFNSELMLFKRT